MSDSSPGSAGLLDVRDVARLLKVSPRSIWEWVSDGDFVQPIRLGRLRRWRLCDVETWLARQADAAREGMR